MFISACFSHSFFLVRGQQVGGKKNQEEASVSLSFDVDRGGGG